MSTKNAGLKDAANEDGGNANIDECLSKLRMAIAQTPFKNDNINLVDVLVEIEKDVDSHIETLNQYRLTDDDDIRGLEKRCKRFRKEEKIKVSLINALSKHLLIESK